MPTSIILYQDGLMELRYCINHDILSFAWPTVDTAQLSHLEHSFGKLRETIKFYVVKRVFVDFRNLEWFPTEVLGELLGEPHVNAPTLQKVGWVTLGDRPLEEKAEAVCRRLFPNTSEFQSFSAQADAIKWFIGA